MAFTVDVKNSPLTEKVNRRRDILVFTFMIVFTSYPVIVDTSALFRACFSPWGDSLLQESFPQRSHASVLPCFRIKLPKKIYAKSPDIVKEKRTEEKWIIKIER